MGYFLRPLTKDTLALKQLLIPWEFVGQCGKKNLTNPVTLELATGVSREVEFYQENFTLFWLRDGWQELVEDYSLRDGQYVVFQYQSPAKLKLLMIDGDGVQMNYPNIPETGGSFLKHLTMDTMASKGLLIPPEFASKCGEDHLTNPVFLKLPVGAPRELKLYKDSQVFWLRNGWQELANRYSLKAGHYLLFSYKSYSTFNVLMFGPNGLSLEFPDFPEAEEEEKTANTDFEMLIGMSQVEDMSNINNNGSGGRHQTQLRSGKSRTTDGEGKGKRKANFEAKSRTADGGGKGKQKANLEASRSNRSPFGRHEVENSHIPSMAGIPELRRDYASTSSENPIFSIIIGKSHLTKSDVTVPAEFVSKHMKGAWTHSHPVTVFGEGGLGPWTLLFNVRNRNDNGNARFSFGAGWIEFCKDTSLKQGDNCQFELISHGRMKVSVRRD